MRTWLPSNCFADAVSKFATLNQCSGRPLIERQLDVRRIAVVDHVAPGQREAALEAPDAGDFPAADETRQRTRWRWPAASGPCRTAATRRSLMLMRCGASESEISRIGAGSEAFSRLTACIHFAKRVAALNGVALREPLGGGELQAVIPGVAGVLRGVDGVRTECRDTGESSVCREVVVPV